MANSFVDPKLASATSLELIKADLVLGRTVFRDAERDFGGKVGDTVTVRRPNRRSARELIRGSNTVTLDDIDNDGVAVKLDHHLYNGAAVTDEEMTLTIEDFAAEVIGPIAGAVAEGIEGTLVDTMQTVSDNATVDAVAEDGSNVKEVFTSARKLLRDAMAPANGLYAACGTGVYASVLSSDNVTRVDASGSNDALRRASVGLLFGFTVLESNLLEEDEVVFYHRDAFSLAVRAPIVPDGVAWGSSVAEGGYGLRFIKDYDATTLSDRVIGSVFAGAEVLTANWVIRNEGLVSS